MSSQHILDSLKKDGHRITTARKATLDAFGDGCNPLSAQDVHVKLGKKGLSTNLTTVYRELQFLADRGIVRTVQFQDGVQRYELSQSDHHHHHLVCTSCNDVQEVAMEHDLEDIEKRIGKQKNFKILSHSLEFYGLCKKCV